MRKACCYPSRLLWLLPSWDPLHLVHLRRTLCYERPFSRVEYSTKCRMSRIWEESKFKDTSGEEMQSQKSESGQWKPAWRWIRYECANQGKDSQASLADFGLRRSTEVMAGSGQRRKPRNGKKYEVGLRWAPTIAAAASRDDDTSRRDSIFSLPSTYLDLKASVRKAPELWSNCCGIWKQ